MKLGEYIKYDGLGLAELIRGKDVSKEEVTAASLSAAELLNPEINAIIETFPSALDCTQAEDAPFQGVPFLIKDLALHAEGTLYEMGSRLSQGLRTPHDTELMSRIRNTGLQVLGRASTPEFGYCPTTEPVVNGPSRNPWNLAHSPGGSSGATAASVAAGIVPLAHANDGGGSIRIPASCCGLVGLKPSRGRVSAGPDAAVPLSGLAVEFAVTRSVRDSARLLDLLHGPGIGEPFEISAPVGNYFDTFEKAPDRLKIAVMSDPWGSAPVDEEVKQACANTAKLCEALGHHVEDAAPQMSWDVFFQATHVLWTANIVVLVDMVAEMTGKNVDETTLESTTLACYQHGKGLSAEDLLKAEAAANNICRANGQFFNEYDLLLTPTLARLPAAIGEMNANDTSLDALGWSTHVFKYCPFTPLFNMTGQPAISLPLQQSSNGLPIGMQFVARFGREDILLQLAREFEQAHPWSLNAPLIDKHLD